MTATYLFFTRNFGTRDKWGCTLPLVAMLQPVWVWGDATGSRTRLCPWGPLREQHRGVYGEGRKRSIHSSLPWGHKIVSDTGSRF